MPKLNFKFYSDFSNICQRNKDDSTGALMAFSEFFQTWEPLDQFTSARLVLLALYEGVNADVLQVLLSIKPLILICDDIEEEEEEDLDEEDEEPEEDGEEVQAAQQEAVNPEPQPLGIQCPIAFLTRSAFLSELKDLIDGRQIPFKTMKVLAESMAIEESASDIELRGDFLAFFHVANNLFQSKFATFDSSNFEMSTEVIQLTNVLISRFRNIKGTYNQPMIIEKIKKYFEIDLTPTSRTTKLESIEWMVLHNSFLMGVKEWHFLLGLTDKPTPEDYYNVLRNYFQ